MKDHPIRYILNKWIKSILLLIFKRGGGCISAKFRFVKNLELCMDRNFYCYFFVKSILKYYKKSYNFNLNI